MPASPKPLRGEFLAERKRARRERVKTEQRAMRAALVRDGHKCRWPRCEFASLKLPIDPCHVRHRGMGGNPKGDRTTVDSIVALCRRHHGLYDAAVIDLEMLNPELGTSGRLAFYRLSESGQWAHVASEQRVGVSETRGAN